MDAYIEFLRVRLVEMRRLMKPTASIYLHCDPTSSHYIKVAMDGIFGRKNFRNEIIWGYRAQGVSLSDWPRKHDNIFVYKTGKGTPTHNPLQAKAIYHKPFFGTQKDEQGNDYRMAYVRDVWDEIELNRLRSGSKERCHYPTQKPVKLLERIIKASSNVGDIVFDPFCGSGTTFVAAANLGRLFAGIDIADNAALIASRLP